MAEFTLATASQKQLWSGKYFQEYIRKSAYLPYMGKSSTSIINVRYELEEQAGKIINIPLVTRLKNGGVTGSTPLDGNEEALGNFNCAISIDWRRNGVRVPKSQSFMTEINLWDAAKDMLQEWGAEKLRDDLSNALFSVELGVSLANSLTATKNAWTVANADRVLFGNLKSNNTSVFSTSIANVATGTGKLTASIAQLAKRLAKLSDPHIRPFKTATGREFYVMFCGARAFRDLKLDTVINTANTQARPREGEKMNDNPLFQDGDIIYDGIIFHEVPEIDAIATANGLDGVGSAACDVRPAFLCGAQALGIAWGQEPQFQTDTLADYKFRPGVALEELLGVRKLFYTSGSAGNLTVQHGMVTVFNAAAADS